MKGQNSTSSWDFLSWVKLSQVEPCNFVSNCQNERLTFHFLSANNMFNLALLSQKLTLFVYFFAGWSGCAICVQLPLFAKNERLTFVSFDISFTILVFVQTGAFWVKNWLLFFSGWPGCAICVQLPLFVKTRGLCSRASTFHSCRHLWKMWRVQVCQRKGLAVLQRGRSQV